MKIIQIIFGGVVGSVIGAVILATLLCLTWGKGDELACGLIGIFTFPIGMAIGVVPGVFITKWYLKKKERK